MPDEDLVRSFTPWYAKSRPISLFGPVVSPPMCSKLSIGRERSKTRLSERQYFHLPSENFSCLKFFGHLRPIRLAEIPHLRLVQQGRSQSLGRPLRPALLVRSAKQRHVVTKKVPGVIQGLIKTSPFADKNLGGQCSGSNPCDQCHTRNSQCVYDLASDHRRKIANQRNIQELAEKGEDIERLCVVLGGILATIRAGNRETFDDLTHTIRNMTGLPELSFYVNGLMETWPEIYLEFQNLDFYLDDAPRRPSVEATEQMDQVSSTAAARTMLKEDPKKEEQPDHTVQRQRVQLDESGANRPMIEPQASIPALSTGELTRGSSIDAEIDVMMEHNRHRSSNSASDSSPAMRNRTARPWEIP